MMYNTLKGLISSITYKPGVIIELKDYGRVLFTLTTACSDNPNKMSLREAELVLPTNYLTMDLEDIKLLIYKHLLDWESHEVQEWYKIQGVRYKDPHLGS